MKNILTAGAALLMTTSIATAGGLDRSGQPVGIIFEEGNVGQLTLGFVTPSVSGTATGPGLTGESGNMAGSYVQVGLAYKQQLSDQFSLALIYDQPYGASVSYAEATGGYYATGSTADVSSSSINAVGRYQINENFSVHGGLRYQTVTASVSKPTAAGYNINSESDAAVGYLVGAAYERPDIALRVALTYNSAVDHEIVATETCTAPLPGCAGTTATTGVTTPQSVNLDFQTGVAADTLVFGSIRWAEWTEFDFAPPVHSSAVPAGIGRGSLQDYDNDVFTYTLGVGRRFNDQWSGAVTLGYEKANGGFSGDLAPTDGYFSVGLGGSYNINDATEITAGVRYVMIGDANTEHPAIPGSVGSEFTDNNVVAIGLQLTTSF